MADKIDTLNKRLKEVKDRFDDLVNAGLNQEILIVYLISKTKLSRKKVKELLKNQKEFYDNLIMEEFSKKI